MYEITLFKNSNYYALIQLIFLSKVFQLIVQFGFIVF